MKYTEVGTDGGVGLRERFGRLTATIRNRVSAFLNPEIEAFGEERDLLLEDELVARYERNFPPARRASLAFAAEQQLARGHSRRTVSAIYGDDITREAGRLLTAREWGAVTRTVIDLSIAVQHSGALEPGFAS